MTDSGLLEFTQEQIDRIKKEAYNTGLHDAATLVDNYGDQCEGGSGREIIPSGPSKGQPYGASFYNTANAIRKLMVE